MTHPRSGVGCGKGRGRRSRPSRETLCGTLMMRRRVGREGLGVEQNAEGAALGVTLGVRRRVGHGGRGGQWGSGGEVARGHVILDSGTCFNCPQSPQFARVFLARKLRICLRQFNLSTEYQCVYVRPPSDGHHPHHRVAAATAMARHDSESVH